MYICLLLIRHGVDVPLIQFSVDGYHVFSTMIKSQHGNFNKKVSGCSHSIILGVKHQLCCLK